MIIFEGKASKNVRKFLLIRILLGVTIANIIAIIILGIPAIMLAIYENTLILLLIVFGGVILSILFGFFNLSYNIPYKITIENELIFAKYKEIENSGEVLNVKRVIDYGNFYDIVFYSHRWRTCICQKDLIVKGTIEEFEQIFEDKIVRKR